MAAIAMKTGWIKPSTILFASEIPVNERAFEFAVAQAREFNAHLIVLHAYDSLVVSASETSGLRYYDYAAAARAEKQHLQPMAEKVRQAGVGCEVVVRAGLAADQILSFARERQIDRIVMGTHSPGAIGKLLVGSVAEAVLRRATIPVYIVGPEVAVPAARDFTTRTILCAVSMQESSQVVAEFAARLAAHHQARLVLQHVIRPQERAQVLAGRSLDDVEADLLRLVDIQFHEKAEIETIVVPGDPTEELLFQSRSQQADLIVLGAQGASAFAAITRHGVVYKTLAHSHCPVITLSPVVLSECGAKPEAVATSETYLAGVI